MENSDSSDNNGSKPSIPDQQSILQENISKFKESIINTSRLVTIFKEKEKELKKAKHVIKSKDEEISKLKSISSKQQRDIEAKIRALGSSKTEITSKITEIENLSSKNSLLKNEKKAIAQELDSFKNSNLALENSNLLEGNKKLSLEIKALQNSLEDKFKIIESLNAIIKKRDENLKSEKKKLEIEITKLKDQERASLLRKESKIKSISSELESERDKNFDLELQIEMKQQQIEELELSLKNSTANPNIRPDPSQSISSLSETSTSTSNDIITHKDNILTSDFNLPLCTNGSKSPNYVSSPESGFTEIPLNDNTTIPNPSEITSLHPPSVSSGSNPSFIVNSSTHNCNELCHKSKLASNSISTQTDFDVAPKKTSSIATQFDQVLPIKIYKSVGIQHAPHYSSKNYTSTSTQCNTYTNKNRYISIGTQYSQLKTLKPTCSVGTQYSQLKTLKPTCSVGTQYENFFEKPLAENTFNSSAPTEICSSSDHQVYLNSLVNKTPNGLKDLKNLVSVGIQCDDSQDHSKDLDIILPPDESIAPLNISTLCEHNIKDIIDPESVLRTGIAQSINSSLKDEFSGLRNMFNLQNSNLAQISSKIDSLLNHYSNNFSQSSNNKKSQENSTMSTTQKIKITPTTSFINNTTINSHMTTPDISKDFGNLPEFANNESYLLTSINLSNSNNSTSNNDYIPNLSETILASGIKRKSEKAIVPVKKLKSSITESIITSSSVPSSIDLSEQLLSTPDLPNILETTQTPKSLNLYITKLKNRRLSSFSRCNILFECLLYFPDLLFGKLSEGDNNLDIISPINEKDIFSSIEKYITASQNIYTENAFIPKICPNNESVDIFNNPINKAIAYRDFKKIFNHIPKYELHISYLLWCLASKQKMVKKSDLVLSMIPVYVVSQIQDAGEFNESM
ncbi:hypothetical protein AYI69_g6340 [Smittium culicis]|uniref:Uncharacterized protein n=1 Tax=Smittium culicis TaxID=133412 RepID=A0A1R1XZJ0_9FUNG|nr:hypothetical protein AYI69_g6340 [Smittium culicis]